MVIAIDYDGTITESVPFPLESNIRPEALLYIPKLVEQGHTLILWTARTSEHYSDCIEKLKKCELFQYFTFEYTTGVTGKVIADVYLDDKSSIGEFNWELWYDYISSCSHNIRSHSKED